MVFLASLLLYLIILLLLASVLFFVILMVFETGESAIIFLLSLISIQFILQTTGNIRKHKRWTDT